MNTVRIACNLLNGLRIGGDVVLAGTNSLRTDRRNRPHGSRSEAAVTEVPRAIWDAWFAQHKNEPICKNRCVYRIEDETEPPAAA